MIHREIIVQLGYNSGHIANPFSPLFYPHRSEYPAPFHIMWPRINFQKILDPQYPYDINNSEQYSYELPKVHLQISKLH